MASLAMEKSPQKVWANSKIANKIHLWNCSILSVRISNYDFDSISSGILVNNNIGTNILDHPFQEHTAKEWSSQAEISPEERLPCPSSPQNHSATFARWWWWWSTIGLPWHSCRAEISFLECLCENWNALKRKWNMKGPSEPGRKKSELFLAKVRGYGGSEGGGLIWEDQEFA